MKIFKSCRYAYISLSLYKRETFQDRSNGVELSSILLVSMFNQIFELSKLWDFEILFWEKSIHHWIDEFSSNFADIYKSEVNGLSSVIDNILYERKLSKSLIYWKFSIWLFNNCSHSCESIFIVWLFDVIH